MNRHQFLSAVHASFQPRSYLEIGINDGRGLRRSTTRTIGVDPRFRITSELACDLQLVRATSDDFFARADAIAWFPEGVVDFTFIDGMHIFEFALRDFINAERVSSPNSVIILDDMLPRTVDEAARDRRTMGWTGDVFKVAAVLERYRPDLVVVGLDTTRTGLLLVLGADPSSTVLREHYDEIIAEYVAEDPQVLSEQVLLRTHAADPAKVAALPVWAELVAARRSGDGGVPGFTSVAQLRGTATYVSDPPQPRPWPPVEAKTAAPETTGARSPLTARDVARRVRRAVRRRQ